MKCRIHTSPTAWVEFTDSDVLNLDQWLTDPDGHRLVLVAHDGTIGPLGVCPVPDPSFESAWERALLDLEWEGKLTHLQVEDDGNPNRAGGEGYGEWCSPETGNTYDTEGVTLTFLPKPRLSLVVLMNHHLAGGGK